jgi:hypothetical protein
MITVSFGDRESFRMIVNRSDRAGDQGGTSLSQTLSRESARDQRPTVRDVAALAGVGLKTVSRVINGEVTLLSPRDILDRAVQRG